MKIPEEPSSAGGIPPYAFARGIRGRYAAPPRNIHATKPPTAVQHVWAPLDEFPWQGSGFQLADDTWIDSRNPAGIWSQDKLAALLSSEDRSLCEGTRHWLHVVREVHSELSAKEGVNTFLLALWIVCPTATQAPLRFQTTDVESGVFHVVDRFQWIPGYACDRIAAKDLESVAAILPALRKHYVAGRRLRNALVLTFRGGVSVDWQSAFICLAAATETLLTYSSAPGVTERLARAYAKIAGAKWADKDAAAAHFKRLYSLRSDIVHGRAYDRHDPERNLRDLADFSEILRTLWGIVLGSEDLRTQLELDDSGRERALADV